MFFRKFFATTFEQIIKKADSSFKNEHYSEARQYYFDALEKTDGAAAHQQNVDYINSMIKKCGNFLAEMNICEAEAAIRSGNGRKAPEYLQLSIELADDVSIREKAEKLITFLQKDSTSDNDLVVPPGKHGCSTCKPEHHSTASPATIKPDHLASDEQFQLLVNTLPGDLPQRYVSLGEEFASAYLLANSDETGAALSKFRQLLASCENDIILCETALLEFKTGRLGECEMLLRKALELNSWNPLCNLSMAQLLVGSGRLDEATASLKSMMERSILYEQSLLMLADVYVMQDSHESAITLLSSGIQLPALKKAAAERLVEILSAQGRVDEAAYLAKSYLKGCC